MRKFFSAPVILLTASILGYGLLIPWLGFALDDWTFLWTSLALGLPGEEFYFTLGNNRPFTGVFYHFLVPLFGMNSFVWHLFSILMLWLSALCLWGLLRLVWPRAGRAGLYSGLLFVLYPGFLVQYTPLVTSHMWLMFACLLGSLALGALAQRRPRWWLPATAVALLLSTFNLISFEYLILPELLRPLLIWFVERGQGGAGGALRRTLKQWLPYALLLGGVMVWRVFFFPLQMDKYQLNVLDGLLAAPMQTGLRLVGTIGKNVVWDTTLRAWWGALSAPFAAGLGRWERVLTLGVSLATAGWFLLVFRIANHTQSSRMELQTNHKTGQGDTWQILITGLTGLLLAGWPFWLTGLTVEPQGWNSRFTLPFIFGAALTAGAFFELLPWKRVAVAGLALLLGFSAGRQTLAANQFRTEWELHTRIFHELAWNIPALEPGTTILSADFPLELYSDNTNTSELNLLIWRNNPSAQYDHGFFYLREMILRGVVPDFTRGRPYRRSLMSAYFYGDTGKAVVFTYRAGACLRLLDPQLDAVNPTLPDLARQAAALSRPELIRLSGGGNRLILPAMFGPEPTPDWCAFSAWAGQALRAGDPLAAADFADRALAQQPMETKDVMLAAPFVEAYLQTGRGADAQNLAREMLAVEPGISAPLCRLWERNRAAVPGFLTCAEK